jgi:hypothetical protein
MRWLAEEGRLRVDGGLENANPSLMLLVPFFPILFSLYALHFSPLDRYDMKVFLFLGGDGAKKKKTLSCQEPVIPVTQTKGTCDFGASM